MDTNGKRHEPRILVPFHKDEALSLPIAARVAGISESTMRSWCTELGLGRKLGGGWRVSRVALAMHLDGDQQALAAYHAGDRCTATVASYFERTGIGGILKLPAFQISLPQIPQTSQIPRTQVT